jgi:hypothetical protein
LNMNKHSSTYIIKRETMMAVVQNSS